jgi:hypothetical protein
MNLGKLDLNLSSGSADSLYGESENFIEALNHHHLSFVVAIRSNHSVLMPPGAKVSRTAWKKFERVFSTGDTEIRYLREIIFGKRRTIRYWQITTDKVELPQNSTWYVMTNLPGEIYKSVGNIYGLRTWIEYGFKQVKDELGWADYRVTNYQEIEKWWEIVCSAYLMISLQSDIFKSLSPESASSKPCPLEAKFKQHQWWDKGVGWKNVLNNLHLVIQPYIFFNLITPWLKIFNIPFLQQGFLHLINIMNEFEAYVPDG